MNEAQWVHTAAVVMEVVGIAIIVIGSFGALGLFLVRAVGRALPLARLVASLRSNLGYTILLGLEFLVAGDIINTVAIEPTMSSLLVLAGIVLIRTFLSFSLEVEIEGRWPWQKSAGRAEATGDTGQD
ncbi:MAG: DUF1622 domain-containing protein [Blastomonas sp.]